MADTYMAVNNILKRDKGFDDAHKTFWDKVNKDPELQRDVKILQDNLREAKKQRSNENNTQASD